MTIKVSKGNYYVFTIKTECAHIIAELLFTNFTFILKVKNMAQHDKLDVLEKDVDRLRRMVDIFKDTPAEEAELEKLEKKTKIWMAMIVWEEDNISIERRTSAEMKILEIFELIKIRRPYACD